MNERQYTIATLEHLTSIYKSEGDVPTIDCRVSATDMELVNAIGKLLILVDGLATEIQELKKELGK